MHIAEVVTIAKSLPLLRLNTYKSLILSYSADYRRIFRKNNLKFILKHLDVFFIFVQICELLIPRLNLFDLSSERELYFVSLSYVMTVKYAV